MEKAKIALIGIGSWGKKLAPELDRQANLTYLMHKDSPETAMWTKENFPKVKSTNNLEEILSDPTILAVVIATPIITHFDIALKALQASKNIFLEKPGGKNSEELNKLTLEAQKRDLIIQVGYEFTYSEKLKEIKEKIGNEHINKISFVWKKWGSFKAHPVINLLVHEISILKALGFNNVKITKYNETKGDNDPDSIYVEAKSNNTIITFEISRASHSKEKIVVIETNENKYELMDENENLIKNEIEEFMSSIKNKTKPLTDGQFAKEILETIEQINY